MEQTHKGWKRAKLHYEVESMPSGWAVTIINASDKTEYTIDIRFPTEESAEKVGQAILDYSYGPANIKTVDSVIGVGHGPGPSRTGTQPRKAPPKKKQSEGLA